MSAKKQSSFSMMMHALSQKKRGRDVSDNRNRGTFYTKAVLKKTGINKKNWVQVISDGNRATSSTQQCSTDYVQRCMHFHNESIKKIEHLFKSFSQMVNMKNQSNGFGEGESPLEVNAFNLEKAFHTLCEMRNDQQRSVNRESDFGVSSPRPTETL